MLLKQLTLTLKSLIEGKERKVFCSEVAGGEKAQGVLDLHDRCAPDGTVHRKFGAT